MRVLKSLPKQLNCGEDMDCSFANRLAEHMRKKKLTLREIGEAIGVTGQAVHHWTKGGGITPDNVKRLAAYLNTTPSLLFFGTEDGLSRSEMELLARLRTMDDATRATVTDFINFQAEQMKKRQEQAKEYVYRFESM
jgi:transcriptional regulator with XRE-family HTH domain